MATSRAVVITGASTGIGAACAVRLDRRGFRVFAGVRREADGAALQRIASDRLTPLILDVTDAAQITAAANTVTASLGGATLVGLVNNAGIAVAGPLEFLPLERLRAQLEVNVIGAVAVTQAFLPLLRQGHGRVVNMGSISGRSAVPLLGPYAASKFALEALTDALRAELRPWGIEVAIVEPGNIATPIWQKSVAAGDALLPQLPPEAHRYYRTLLQAVRTVAVRGTGLPADRVAQAVEHALTAGRPRTRYLIGTDARIQLMLTYLPDRLRDQIIAWFMARGGAG